MLITGEYLVLEGAKVLAVPCKLGQTMTVNESPGSELVWKSYDHKGELWFSANIDLMGFDIIKTTDKEVAKTLRSLLRAVCQQDGDFLSKWKKYKVDTYLEFDRSWGLGSSSTLVWCLAKWADVNPYILLFDSLGGSGYDVACADAEGPILYQLGEESLTANSVDFDPTFKKELYLVYLGKKQSTKDALKHFYKNKRNLNGSVDSMSNLTQEIISANSLTSFESLIDQHESKMSGILGLPTIKSELFQDFWGSVKSLGAWGGDFALVTSSRPLEETKAYFAGKGHETFFSFEEVVLL